MDFKIINFLVCCIRYENKMMICLLEMYVRKKGEEIIVVGYYVDFSLVFNLVV